MRRIQHATRKIDANGAGKDGFYEGSVAQNIPPTVITAQFMNDLQEELVGVVEAAGLVPSSDRTQLAQAIAIAATGSSSANAISIRGTSVLASPLPVTGDVLQHNGTAYLPGKVTNANVSASAAVAVSKLAGSTDGHLLGSVGGVPTWQNGANVIRGVGVSATSPTADDMLRYTGGSYVPGKITNANVATSAAIAPSKIQAGALGYTMRAGPAGVPQWSADAAYTLLSSNFNYNLAIPGSDHMTMLVCAYVSTCSISGLEHGAAPPAYDMKLFVNGSGGSTMTLKHQDPAASPANRFSIFPTGGDLVMAPGKVVILMSISSAAWIVYSVT